MDKAGDSKQLFLSWHSLIPCIRIGPVQQHKLGDIEVPDEDASPKQEQSESFYVWQYFAAIDSSEA